MPKASPKLCPKTLRAIADVMEESAQEIEGMPAMRLQEGIGGWRLAYDMRECYLRDAAGLREVARGIDRAAKRKGRVGS